MKYGMYSICDKFTCYDYPFASYSNAAAIRQFEMIINNNEITKSHPADYDLYKVGEFDTENGIVTPVTPNEFISTGLNVFRKDE